jgi:hypothetical protein
VPLLLLDPPFIQIFFLVHHLVNWDDRQLLAHAMASDFSVAWQCLSKRTIVFFITDQTPCPTLGKNYVRPKMYFVLRSTSQLGSFPSFYCSGISPWQNIQVAEFCTKSGVPAMC